MSERLFQVSDHRANAGEPALMPEDEFRQTYGFLIDVIDLERFRQVTVVYADDRLEVSEIFEPPNQHALPQ